MYDDMTKTAIYESAGHEENWIGKGNKNPGFLHKKIDL